MSHVELDQGKMSYDKSIPYFGPRQKRLEYIFRVMIANTPALDGMDLKQADYDYYLIVFQKAVRSIFGDHGDLK